MNSIPAHEGGSEFFFQDKFFWGLFKQPSTDHDPMQALTGFSQTVAVSLSVVLNTVINT